MIMLRSAETTPDGGRLAMMQREHETTPFIICGIDSKQRPMLECGFRGYCNIDAAQSEWPRAYVAFQLIIDTINRQR